MNRRKRLFIGTFGPAALFLDGAVMTLRVAESGKKKHVVAPLD
jgi:hypothetical protein